MIKKLTELDNEKLLDFLNIDRDYNALLIGDVVNYGYAAENVEVWGRFSAKEELDAVFLRYDNFVLLSAKQSGRDCTAFLPLINKHATLESICGRTKTIKPFTKLLQKECHVKSYMRLAKLTDVQSRLVEVELATTGDATLIDDLLVSVEFGFYPGEIVERYQRTLAKGEARYFIVKQDGKIVACAATAAECAQSAVIVSVCCRKEYRRRGYAEVCVRELCRTLTSEGKQLYLFYENPLAGTLYEKLGFATIGDWAMIETEMI